MDKNEILKRLEQGNDRFVHCRLEGHLPDQKKRDQLVQSQNPFALILSCSDSRVVPEFIFDSSLGELFVIRVMGAVAGANCVSSIEYALHHFGIKVIVVLGHENCGAVSAAIKGESNGCNFKQVFSQIDLAIRDAGKGASVSQIIKANAQLIARNLASDSEIIKSLMEKGAVVVKPAFYNLSSGKVDFLS